MGREKKSRGGRGEEATVCFKWVLVEERGVMGAIPPSLIGSGKVEGQVPI